MQLPWKLLSRSARDPTHDCVDKHAGKVALYDCKALSWFFLRSALSRDSNIRDSVVVIVHCGCRSLIIAVLPQ